MCVYANDRFIFRTLAMHSLAAVSRPRLLETGPSRFVFETYMHSLIG